VSLYLAQLVHKLQLVHADVASAVPARQVPPVGRDPDAADAVTLVVHGLLLLPVLAAGTVAVAHSGGVSRLLFDVVQVTVDVEGLDEVLGVDVSPVDGVCGHVGAEIPYPDCVVRAAGDERSGREDGLGVVAVGHRVRVDLEAPDARAVEDERVRLANLKCRVVNASTRAVWRRRNKSLRKRSQKEILCA
jgi:hypothetical protein